MRDGSVIISCSTRCALPIERYWFQFELNSWITLVMCKRRWWIHNISVDIYGEATTVPQSYLERSATNCRTCRKFDSARLLVWYASGCSRNRSKCLCSDARSLSNVWSSWHVMDQKLCLCSMHSQLICHLDAYRFQEEVSICKQSRIIHQELHNDILLGSTHRSRNR